MVLIAGGFADGRPLSRAELDAVAAKIHWDGSKKRPSQLKSTVPKQKITATEKHKEIEALATNTSSQAKLSASPTEKRLAPQFGRHQA
jgi:hypothetical protein